MNTGVLAFEQVCFAYRPEHRAVLRDLSLEIPSGQVTAILGPNGAGKTTLLHLALGWLTPQSGQVRLAGRPLAGYARRELGRRLALVPQREHVSFSYSLHEYALLGRAPYLSPLGMPGPNDDEIAAQALDRVGLGQMAKRAVTTLSGGERQLALIARALAQQPQLLLLDEPTSHLDLANKIRVLGLLQELAVQEVTILLTSHDPQVAAAVAAHLVLVREGQVLAAGPTPDTLTAANLSAAYGVPVQVITVRGRLIVLA